MRAVKSYFIIYAWNGIEDALLKKNYKEEVGGECRKEGNGMKD